MVSQVFFCYWGFVILVSIQAISGDSAIDEQVQDHLKRLHEDTPTKSIAEEVISSNDQPELIRSKRDLNFEEIKADIAEGVSHVTPSQNDLEIYSKRSSSAAAKNSPSPPTFVGNKGGIGWWPWNNGVATVRRSYFIPRLGKRTNLHEIDEEEETTENAEDEELTPAEAELLKDLLMKNLNTDDYFPEDSEPEEFEEYPEIVAERNVRSYAFVPRLGKRSFSFSPRLGKKSFSFSPRLGKKSYSFSPRLGKKAYSFSPRLGKKSYTFSPRLGKKAYSFSPRLGKRYVTFSPRLGKKAYSFYPRLG